MTKAKTQNEESRSENFLDQLRDAGLRVQCQWQVKDDYQHTNIAYIEKYIAIGDTVNGKDGWCSFILVRYKSAGEGFGVFIEDLEPMIDVSVKNIIERCKVA